MKNVYLWFRFYFFVLFKLKTKAHLDNDIFGADTTQTSKYVLRIFF